MFSRCLIANRGEVAARVARACREMGVQPVGVYSRADRGASWLELMEEAVCVGPAPASESYLRGERLLQAALQTHCSALHPGWGFLAEDPRFAALCRQHGIAFVGPPAGVMARMGVKSPAKRAMREAGLEVVPGSDGPVADLESALRCAAESGYPILLKADRGGGGRGMRLCRDEGELRAAFRAAAAEALSAFGSGLIYLERYLTGGRHVEVQLLADDYGAAVHLGERDCSVQRKHQKLIEESPSPALDSDERAELGRRAAEAARVIGYRGAGTIEFLRDSGGRTYFMEMNTRLQVEHPVSELTSGVDIVVQQLRVAAGEPLGLSQDGVRLRGHAIECRLNAEDPLRDFRPGPGRLAAFEFPAHAGPGRLRVDTHLRAGDVIPPHYDSLLAKVIAWGETRAEALETLLQALRGARIEGVPTTLPLHLAVLESPAFQSGEYDTSAIPGWPPAAAAASS